MVTFDEFIQNVIDRFHITDAVFLMIQNDKELMKQYLDFVADGSLQQINSRIGRRVKTELRLTNEVDNRNDEPVSTLIQSHQVFNEDGV